jgi:hypothetical protein
MFTERIMHQGNNYLRSALKLIHKLINSISNKEELPNHWKESVIVPIHKQGDKTDCSNYGGISQLSTSYKMLSNILLLKLSSYTDKIIADHQCGFRRNRSITDRIFLHSSEAEEKIQV